MPRLPHRNAVLLLAGIVVTSAILAAQERTIELKVVNVAYDMAKLLQPSTLSDDALRGRVIWQQRCAFCHDGVGTPTYNTLGPYLEAELVQKRGDAALREKILKGSSTMPGFQYGLSAPQVDHVMAFLKNDHAGPEADVRAKGRKVEATGRPLERGHAAHQQPVAQPVSRPAS